MGLSALDSCVSLVVAVTHASSLCLQSLMVGGLGAILAAQLSLAPLASETPSAREHQYQLSGSAELACTTG